MFNIKIIVLTFKYYANKQQIAYYLQNTIIIIRVNVWEGGEG